ncbi:hypothetical protein GCM10007392_48010 [Saccharospirillum salsuginis]|uniref:SbsA Ig-like domain-containing protein n=1 Tax=Saccharospirillum salsuginis TaxID=418750 RepID=A0A918KTC5_9GAMM|nr:hypothetical protein GCM10007392_48010 [Saccharospirillum salsuginis]
MNLSLKPKLLTALLAIFALAGCNETGSSGDTSDNSDEQNQDSTTTDDSDSSDGEDSGGDSTLTVANVYPSDGSTDVPVGAAVYAEMDKDIDSTFNSNEMELTLQGTLVPGSVDSLNGTHTKRITYTPSEELETNTEYHVTLNAGQLTANDGSTLASDYQWSFTTGGLSWSSDLQLDGSADAVYDPVGLKPLDSNFVDTAIDAEGNVLTVWVELNADQTTFDVVFRRYDVSTDQLSSRKVIGQTTSAFGASNDKWVQTRPSIALDGQGNAWVAWAENTEASQRMLVRYYSKSGGWEAAQELATDTNTETNVEHYKSPDLQVNNSGDAVVVWAQNKASNNAETIDMIRASTYQADSGAWSYKAKLEAYDEVAGIDADWYERRAVNPAVALQEDGTAIAVWVENFNPDSQYSGTEETVFARRFDGTDWSATATRLESVDLGTHSDMRPRIQVADAGVTGVFWDHPDEGFRFATHSATGGWSGTSTLFATSDAELVRYRAAADGTHLLAWYESDELTVSQKTGSGSWSSPQSVSVDVIAVQEILPVITVTGDMHIGVVDGSVFSPANSLGIEMVSHLGGQWKASGSVTEQNAVWPDMEINSQGTFALAYHVDMGQLPETGMDGWSSKTYLLYSD